MKCCRVATVVFAVAFQANSARADDRASGLYFKSPDAESSIHRASCGQETYVFGYRRGGEEKGVSLLEFTRASSPLPDAMIDKAERELAKYGSISSIEFACGVGKKESESGPYLPANFFEISIRGLYLEGSGDAYQKCRERGWHFEYDTRRDLRIEEDVLTVDGIEIGYCHGETTYFTVPLDAKENSE